MSPPAALTPPHEMAPAPADSCLKKAKSCLPTAPPKHKCSFFLFGFPPQSFYFSLFTSRCLPRALHKAGSWRGEFSPHKMAFGSPPGTAPHAAVGLWAPAPAHSKINVPIQPLSPRSCLSRIFSLRFPNIKGLFVLNTVTGSAQGAMWYLVSLQYMFL